MCSTENIVYDFGNLHGFLPGLSDLKLQVYFLYIYGSHISTITSFATIIIW